MKTGTTEDRKTGTARPTASPEAEPVPAQLADASAINAAEQRYLEALDGLVADAVKHGRLAVLADTLAWTIARIVVGCGVAAAGDILRNVGRYVCEFTTRQEAEAEAEAARKEGRPVH